MSTSVGAPPFDAAAEEARLARNCERLVDTARREGADEAEAYGAYGQVADVSFEKGDIKLATVDDGTSYGLRVFRDRRLGFASTNQTDEPALEAAARDACGLAAFSPPDEANVLPGARPIRSGPPLVRPEVAALGLEEVIERGRDFVSRIAARDPRIAIDKADFSVSRYSVAVASSTGVRATDSDARVSFSTFGMAVDGDDVGGFDYWGDGVRDLGRLDAAVDETIERFCEAVLGNLGARAAETYTGPVLFSPTAFLSVFASPLLSAASAIAVQRGRSALAGKLGQPVGDARLTITDDPTDVELAGTATFDREGQPCGRFPIVEGGVLRSYLYNAYAAHVEGRESTGHASGGTRAAPGLGCHAVSVAAGAGGSRDDLLATLGKGLFVQRFSGTVKPDSGDFSGVAKSARWVENGRVVRSLRETLISGNAFQLLGRIVALGSTSESIFGSARAPYALVDGVSVTAG
jgi:PmbA protein